MTSNGTTRVDSDIVVSDLELQMLEEKKALEISLEKGAISAAEFANKINQLLTTTLERAAQKLSPDDFERHFGFKFTGQPVVLVDPKVAAASADQK